MTDVGERRLADAVLDSIYDLFRAMRALPGAELEEDLGGVSVHHAYPTNPTFKGVWGLTETSSEAALVGALDWLAERDAPFGYVWGDHRAPAWLPAAAERLGLATFDVGAPGMGAALDELEWSALDRAPDGFAVERAESEESVADWGRTFVASFGAPDWAGQAWVDATLRLGPASAPWSLYVGRLDGAPVATAMLFCGAGVATVHAVGTLAAARRRGIGAAVTLAAFADARERGYGDGVLISTEEGYPVYRRLGFRDCGTAVTRWIWQAA